MAFCVAARKCILGDEPGLGKTVQALATASHWRQSWPFLVLVPKQVLYMWRKEIEKFLPEDFGPGGSYRVAIEDGTKACQKVPADVAGRQVGALITTHDLAATNIGTLSNTGYSVVIVDEAHRYKSTTTKKCIAVLPLLKVSFDVVAVPLLPSLSPPRPRPAPLTPPPPRPPRCSCWRPAPP